MIIFFCHSNNILSLFYHKKIDAVYHNFILWNMDNDENQGDFPENMVQKFTFE